MCDYTRAYRNFLIKFDQIRPFHGLHGVVRAGILPVMNSFTSYLEPQNKASTRIVAAFCLFFATFVFAGCVLMVIVLAAAQLIHLGMDVTLVINIGLAVSLVSFYLIVTRLPEQQVFTPEKYIAAPPIEGIHRSHGIFFSAISASPFIPPRYLSSAH